MTEAIKNFYTCKREVLMVLTNLHTDKKGAYKNAYSSLANTLESIIKLYAEHHLVFSQSTFVDGELVQLKTSLTCDLTGESEECIMPVARFPLPDSQKFGSALSYARRFSMQTLGLVAPDETLEDDGEAVKGIAIPAPKPPKPKEEPKAEPVIPMTEQESSEARKKYLAQLARITTREQLKVWAKDTKQERDRMDVADQAAIRTEFNNIDTDLKG